MPAGDIFQHKIDEIFRDMPNMFGITDNILVIGYDENGAVQKSSVKKLT